MHGKQVSVSFSEFRECFIDGFEAGYDEEKRTGIRTSEIVKGIDFSRFLEVFKVLRDSCSLVPEPIRRVVERRGRLSDLLYGKEKSLENYILKEDKDVYNILDKNRVYQKDLLGKNYNNFYKI